MSFVFHFVIFLISSFTFHSSCLFDTLHFIPVLFWQNRCNLWQRDHQTSAKQKITLFSRLELDNSFSAQFRKMDIFYLDRGCVKILCTSLPQVSCSNSPTVTPSSGSNSLFSPIGSVGRPKSLTNGSLCSESTTSSVSSLTSNYPKAPGFEREDQVHRLLSIISGRPTHIEHTFNLSVLYSSFYFFFFMLNNASSVQFQVMGHRSSLALT